MNRALATAAKVAVHRIIVIDDDRDYAESLQDLLEAHDFGTVHAEDEASARRLIESFRPQVAFIDVRLNRGNGVELLRVLSGDFPDLICIMITAYAETETLLEALRNQAYDYLRKPVQPADLFDSLNRALDKLALRGERDAAQHALRESEERFRVIADTSPVALLICRTADGLIRYTNRQADALFADTSPNILGRALPELFHDPDARRMVTSLLTSDVQVHGVEIMLHASESAPVCVSLSARSITLQGEDVVCCALLDVTEAYQLARQLSYQAAYDSLTGLVNRREFETRLQRVIERARLHRTDNALCYLDLDQFKVINDTCGHVAGDELLRQLSQELHGHIRKDDTLARLGGDEFAILVENCALPQAERVANAVRQAIQDFRFAWEENNFKLGVSIGLVPIGQAGESVSNVMRRADAACYAAKDKGRNRIHVYDVEDEELAQRHGEMRWVSRINSALEENRFELYAQKIVPVTGGTGTDDHYEMLIRMRDDTGGTIPPGAFLPAAERYNLASRIDRWVARATFAWLAAHPLEVAGLAMFSINVSGQSLSDDDFVGDILHLFDTSWVPPAKICFEITETSAIANPTTANKFIRALKERGCNFALDDFGSGLSSFAYLKNLPVDYLKIDGQFVKDILIDPIDFAMVKSINEIGHVMGKKTIAEFVENEAILAKLREIGVDYAQGYGIGKPVPIRTLSKVTPLHT